MKKYRIILSLAVLLLTLLASRIIPLPVLPSLFLGTDTDDEFLLSSTSPEGAYTLSVWRIREGATVADSIRVYRDFGPVTGCIYNGYRETEASIVWLSDSVVTINGVTLDMDRGETYDWRR